jgi:hypothetical protein
MRLSDLFVESSVDQKSMLTELWNGPPIEFKWEYLPDKITAFTSIENPLDKSKDFTLEVTYYKFTMHPNIEDVDDTGGDLNGYELVFSINERTNQTGKFNSYAYRVFTAVVQSAEKMVNDFHPDFFMFSGIGESRVKLYKSLSSSLTKRLSWIAFDSNEIPDEDDDEDDDYSEASMEFLVCAPDNKDVLLSRLMANTHSSAIENRAHDRTVNFALTKYILRSIGRKPNNDLLYWPRYEITKKSKWFIEGRSVIQQVDGIRFTLSNAANDVNTPWQLSITTASGQELPKINDIRIILSAVKFLRYAVIAQQVRSSVFMIYKNNENVKYYRLLFKAVAEQGRANMKFSNLSISELDPHWVSSTTNLYNMPINILSISKT